MRTTDSLSWFTFTNWGPLTTPYVAPASCTGTPSFVDLGTNSEPLYATWPVECTVEGRLSCLPTPTDPLALQSAFTVDGNGGHLIPFYSPGMVCPSGWKTLGVASRPPGTNTWTETGAFSLIGTQPAPHFPLAHNMIPQLLEPRETAVICCPSSMSMGFDGECYSLLPSYTISTACAVVNGSTIRATIAPSDITSDNLIAATRMFPVYLVHQTSATATAASTQTSSNAAETSSASPSSAAERLSPGQTGGWGQVNAMVGLLAISAVAGAALLLPW
ncbi:hypothetical protein ARAM_002689 [Aspergillus rambellii]|uniref:Uncharacterized protein n=1 Tax=Aspergillus rambellii TaxID=308745 RepID=A0A0F8TXP9_9EURO|nr:hypothetical protein ARAM_002689 [Aspergillus rambellii]